MERENFYKILGISPDASQKEIEETLHEQFREWYHRLNAPSLEKRQQAEKMLKKLEIIEEILLNEEKRKQYDQELMEALEKETVIKQN